MTVPGRRALRVLAGVELEAHRLQLAPAGDVDRDVHALRAVEKNAIELARRTEQAPVGPEQMEWNKLVLRILKAIPKAEEQAARIARVEDLQPYPARHHRPVGVEP